MKKSNEQHKDTLSKRVSRNSEQASKGSGPKTPKSGPRIKTAAERRKEMAEKYGKSKVESNLKKKK
jgi:hypothetical protein